MSARDDLVAAAQSLHARGLKTFTLSDVVAETVDRGSRYAEVTLRSMVSHHLRIDKRKVAGGVGFIQMSRGVYQLSHSDVIFEAPAVPRSATVDPSPLSDVTPYDSAADARGWTWEGNIQAAVVRHVANQGWKIRRVANTESREHGIDIEADLDGVSILIEVKGYPSERYRNGPNEGQKKTFGVGAQARTYFGNALLAGVLMRSDNPDDRIVLAFPEVETYATLARRSLGPLGRAGIDIWLVGEDGAVREVGPTE